MNGNILWCQNIGGGNEDQAIGVTQLNNGSYVVAVNFNDTINVNTEKSATMSSSGGQDVGLIGYDTSGKYLWRKSFGSSNNEKLNGIIKLEDGNILVYGGFSGGISIDGKSLASKGNMDSMLLKFFADSNGANYINGYTFGGSEDENVSQVVETKNGGLLVGGYTLSPSFNIGSISTGAIGGKSNGYVVKLNNSFGYDGFYDIIKGTSSGEYQEVKTVSETINGDYVIGGWFSSVTSSLTNYGKNITCKGYNDSFVVKYGSITTSPEVPEITEIIVENDLKKFGITTEVKSHVETNSSGNKVNVLGGNIDGNYGIFNGTTYLEENNIKYVETVKYGKNGTQSITITPDKNYVVSSIKINGVNYPFEPLADGRVVLPAFENVTEDKHIVVEFGTSALKVNHYFWSKEQGLTEIKVSDTENYSSVIGQAYTTLPKTDINYSIITNEDYYKTEKAIPDPQMTQ